MSVQEIQLSIEELRSLDLVKIASSCESQHSYSPFISAFTHLQVS